MSAKTKATPPRQHWGPDNSVTCSHVLVSVSPPFQPGHQGSTGRSVTAPPTAGGQPTSTTPKQPNSCSFCFQPLHEDRGQAVGFLTLLELPLWQVEDRSQLLPLFPIELASLWPSLGTWTQTLHSPLSPQHGHWSILMLFPLRLLSL